MRVAVISDVHSNLEALKAVLRDISAQGAERIYSLGDVLGYGPSPLECLETILEDSRIKGVVKGNHDYCVGNFYEKNEEIEFLVKENAFAGMEYSRWQIAPPLLAEINSWPEKMVAEDIGFSMAHGSFSGDHLWRYVCREDPIFAYEEFDGFSTKICLIGHTHRPFVYPENDQIDKTLDHPWTLDGRKFLINVGSVGQPRDSDPRAAYGLFTFEKEATFFLRRVAYDVAKTVKGIKAAKLPAFLHERLLEGI